MTSSCYFQPLWHHKTRKKPKIGELELELERYACRALKCLVLLHKENVEAPTRTAEWLNLRGWLTNHFHVKIPSLMLNAKAQRFRQELISKIRAINESPFSDFSRLGKRFSRSKLSLLRNDLKWPNWAAYRKPWKARFLTGNSIALVLGGGGARGITQIGIIDSLRKKVIFVNDVINKNSEYSNRYDWRHLNWLTNGRTLGPDAWHWNHEKKSEKVFRKYESALAKNYRSD